MENALAGAGFGSQPQLEPLWAEAVFETALFDCSGGSLLAKETPLLVNLGAAGQGAHHSENSQL